MPPHRRATLPLASLLLITLGASAPALKGRRLRHDSRAPMVASLPLVHTKPMPKAEEFDGCPPEGSGKRFDAELNRLKNRVDYARRGYYHVSFDAILNLKWPESVGRRHRNTWKADALKEVKQFEGLPVMIEAYIHHARLMGRESPNCGRESLEERDHHIWIKKSPGAPRSKSIVVEFTPRVRRRHTANWSTGMLNRIARARLPVRVAGWLLLDQEHPSDVRKSRGTIWEIHPVMEISVKQRGKWVLLDKVRELGPP